MKEIHFFKESQREEIPSPDFQDSVTIKLLLQFLCDLCTWTGVSPHRSTGIEKNANSIYILFRGFAFPEQEFWQTFGGYLIVLHQKWEIEIFGTELATQETVELSLEQQNDSFYAVQKTVSGNYADSISSLCLRIECADAKEVLEVELLCQKTDWQSGILVADWELRKVFEQENISWLRQNTCYCYGNISEDPKQGNYLDAMSFSRKADLWRRYLEHGFDYAEFEWLYDKISRQELNERTEWELALYSALNQLNYTLKISESEFELYDGKGERLYFSFDSEQNARKAFLKLLFPVNVFF